MGKTCPKCGDNLKRETAAKYSKGGAKPIGYYRFCPNMNCDYESGITST